MRKMFILFLTLKVFLLDLLKINVYDFWIIFCCFSPISSDCLWWTNLQFGIIAIAKLVSQLNYSCTDNLNWVYLGSKCSFKQNTPSTLKYGN